MTRTLIGNVRGPQGPQGPDTGVMTAFIAPKVIDLSEASSVLVDASLGNVFNLTLTTSSDTLANPSNSTDGQTIRFRIVQGGSGSHTLAYGSAYDFGASSAPVLSTATGKVDVLGFEFIASISKWRYLGSALG